MNYRQLDSAVVYERLAEKGVGYSPLQKGQIKLVLIGQRPGLVFSSHVQEGLKLVSVARVVEDHQFEFGS